MLDTDGLQVPENPKTLTKIVETQETIIITQEVLITNLQKTIGILQLQFETEKNIKNNLYAFILSQGLFSNLQNYEMSTNMKSPDGLSKVISLLIMKLPENSN